MQPSPPLAVVGRPEGIEDRISKRPPRSLQSSLFTGDGDRVGLQAFTLGWYPRPARTTEHHDLGLKVTVTARDGDVHGDACLFLGARPSLADRRAVVDSLHAGWTGPVAGILACVHILPSTVADIVESYWIGFLTSQGFTLAWIVLHFDLADER